MNIFGIGKKNNMSKKKETKEKAVVNDCSTCGGSGSDPERDPGEKSCQTCEGRGHGTGYKK